MDVAEGDEIVFSKYGGTEIKVGTDEYLILRESRCAREGRRYDASRSAQRPKNRGGRKQIWLTRS